MELMTISEISKNFKISTRTLRYYEQIGLLKSTKKEGYAYRAYDEESILRLQQIIILRKLHIQLKEIANILDDEDVVTAIEIFKKNVNELVDKINSLSMIKEIINRLIDELEKNKNIQIHLNLLSNYSILDVIDSSSLSNFDFKEEKSMEELNKATKKFKEALQKYLGLFIYQQVQLHQAIILEKTQREMLEKQLEKFLKESNLY